jgi:flagella basal body P-ring formation protein FlgA
VIARRDARGPQPAARTCCLRTTDSENNKETFFGDFLPLSKKLPAACGGSFCSKEEDQKQSRWIPAFAGMTSCLSQELPTTSGGIFCPKSQKPDIPAVCGLPVEVRIPTADRMRTLLSLILLLNASTAFADFEPLDNIRNAAIGAVSHGEPDTAAQVTLDANLQMPKCGAALQANGGQRGVSEVSCATPTAWKLYVPVKLTRSQAVIVLVHSVGAGQAITPDAIASEKRDAAAIVGAAIYDPAQAIGRVASRTLVAGGPLLETDLMSPRAVRRGEAVMLVVRSGGVDVRAPGKAVGDAGINERVNVENMGSHRIVQGIVRGGGEVEVAQ